jgi:hypothetical protein
MVSAMPIASGNGNTYQVSWVFKRRKAVAGEPSTGDARTA